METAQSKTGLNLIAYLKFLFREAFISLIAWFFLQSYTLDRKMDRLIRWLDRASRVLAYVAILLAVIFIILPALATIIMN
ncbi:MAG: hypothetical protein JW943_07455 [Deltaproteobacteria bacterium]|nr:hypothetical protein [Deltaproteobacteria bacterium]